MDEYSPSDEIGIPEDRQFICSSYGFLNRNNFTRNICARYIKNGDRVFDILSRYSDLSVYTKKARDGASRELMRNIVPLLKVNGITDYQALLFAKEDLEMMPGAKKAIQYIDNLQPCFINTGAFEHHAMSLSDETGFPMANVNCSMVSFDPLEISRAESDALRNMASKISNMNVRSLPDRYTEPGTFVSRENWDAVQELDSIFLDKMPSMDFYEQLVAMSTVGANEKSYALLEIRRQSSIDFDSTFYVGSGPTDHQAMDIVSDGGGLALSFNGCEDTVRNSNISVISSDSVTVSVLAAEFYNGGMEAVHDVIDNWNREYLTEKEGPDRHLIDTLLETFPKRLPEVFVTDADNVDDIVERSEAYRKKFYRD